MPVTIEYSIDASQLRAATDAHAERISTVGRVLKAAREDMRLSVRERYDEEKSLDGTPWAPLAAATLARKKMDYLRRRIAAAPELWRDVQIWTRKTPPGN